MAKQHFVVFGFSIGVAESGGHFLNAQVRAGTFGLQIHPAVFSAVAHSGQIVGNHPQALHLLKLFRPYRRLIAVHITKERQAIGALQHDFYFTCAFDGLLHAPLWRYTRVHHGVAVLMMNEGAI